MRVFVDNDIAVKLAKWGLLQRFSVHVKRQGGAELHCLQTLRYKFCLKQPDRAAALLGSSKAAKQLTDFVDGCRPVKLHSATVAAVLTDIPNIDAGEAALFAAAAYFDAVLLDTGDKRALRALGALGANHVAVKALLEKVCCLEQTVHHLVGRWTYAQVHGAVVAVPHADTATHACFNGKSEAQALAALHRKIEELRPQCGGTLATTPFGWIC